MFTTFCRSSAAPAFTSSETTSVLPIMTASVSGEYPSYETRDMCSETPMVSLLSAFLTLDISTREMHFNLPRNDQRSAKTSQTSLTDLSLVIGTPYESFVSSHEKLLIPDFLIFVIILSSFSSSSVNDLAHRTKE